MKKSVKNKKNSIPKIIFKAFAFVLVLLLVLIGVCYAVCEFMPGKKAEKGDITNEYITSGGALVSAHRSGADIAPENTMAAFKYCIENEDFNVDVFEFDLHITKDNRLILLHDNTLDRTTDSVDVFGEKGVKPSEKTYEELRELNFGANFCNADGEYPYRGLKGDKVPDDLRAVLLEDVLDYLDGVGEFDYIIEIKDSGELGEKAADELYRILKEKDLVERVVFGTFNASVTKYVDEKCPEMLRSSSIGETAIYYFAAAFNLELPESYYKFDALQIPASGYGVFNLASERIVNYAHRHNIAVQYWTVNDPEDVEKLDELGADCIMSDKPDMAYDIING